MVNLNLQSNESVILQKEGVLCGGVMSAYTNELYLTNINFILVRRGMFGSVKGIEKYPLRQIKIVNNQAQAIMGSNPVNGSKQLQVYMQNGQIAFEFQSGEKKAIQSFIEGINKALGCTPPDSAANSSALPGTQKVAETLRDTIGTFKGALGIKGKSAQQENVTIKCIGCRAPLSGVKGQQIKCTYCDTKQTL